MEISNSIASTSNNSSSMNEKGTIIVRQSGMMRIEFPFTLKVGQVFTGFGVGCGLGIGVGRPINLGTFSLLFSFHILVMDFGTLFKRKNGDNPHQLPPQKPCKFPNLCYIMLNWKQCFWFMFQFVLIVCRKDNPERNFRLPSIELIFTSFVLVVTFCECPILRN